MYKKKNNQTFFYKINNEFIKSIKEIYREMSFILLLIKILSFYSN